MKGFMWWTTISLISALIIIGWGSYMLYGQVNNYVEMNTKYQALEISGIINALQASPKETSHDYEPPYCAKIEKNVTVDVVVEDLALNGLITTSIGIEPGEIGCGGSEKSFVREDKIRIKS